MNQSDFQNHITEIVRKRRAEVFEALKKGPLRYKLHPEDRGEYEWMQTYATAINTKFQLYSGDVQVNPIQTDALWGLCEYDKGIVHLLFRFPGEDWRVERRQLIRVLCHELTHFKVLGHEENFFTLCNQVIDYARDLTNEPKLKMERFIPKDCATYGF